VDIAASVANSNRRDFMLTFSPEEFAGTCTGDTGYLRVSATLKRGDTWNERPLIGSLPLVLELHGHLGPEQGYNGTGAMLEPISEVPIDLTSEKNYAQMINLVFVGARRLFQQWEEERAKNSQARKMILKLRLWGTVALVAPKYEPMETAETQPIESTPFAIGRPKDPRIEVVGLKMLRLENNNGERIEISLSHWEDILPGLGYPQRASFELPALDARNLPEEVRAAAEHVHAAQQFFQQEKYGAAVQRCRQARDALLVPNKKTWCQEHLGHVMGMEKALMLDEAISALNRLGNPASHGDSPVEIDRAAAEYVIGTLTLILHYIDRKLQ
jgi:hypothetical protein